MDREPRNSFGNNFHLVFFKNAHPKILPTSIVILNEDSSSWFGEAASRRWKGGKKVATQECEFGFDASAFSFEPFLHRLPWFRNRNLSHPSRLSHPFTALSHIHASWSHRVSSSGTLLWCKDNMLLCQQGTWHPMKEKLTFLRAACLCEFHLKRMFYCGEWHLVWAKPDLSFAWAAAGA